MSPIDNFREVLTERYAQFDGRANRAEYWWFAAVNLGAAVIFNILAAIAGFFILLYVLWSLALIIPSLALGFRRMHDIDRSAWWLLILLIPFIGFLIVLWFFVTPGTAGPNQFGPAPDPS